MSGADLTRAPLTIPTADGWRLAAERVAPARTAPWAVVLASHALFCNRTTLDGPPGGGLASTLARRGIATYLLDLRAHGGSARGPQGAPAGYDDLIERDIPAAVRAVAGWHPGVPLFLLGHSLGAHVSLFALARDPGLPVAGVVSLGGTVWTAATAPERSQRLVQLAAMGVFSGVARALGRFPARRLGLGLDDAPLGLVQALSAAACRRRVGADRLAALATLRQPVLSVVSTADRFYCRPASARRFLAHARDAAVVERCVGDRPADPRGVGHIGLVTDRRMRPIWGEIADWIEHRGRR